MGADSYVTSGSHPSFFWGIPFLLLACSDEVRSRMGLEGAYLEDGICSLQGCPKPNTPETLLNMELLLSLLDDHEFNPEFQWSRGCLCTFSLFLDRELQQTHK